MQHRSMRRALVAVVLAAATASSGCRDDLLNVPNQTNPDIERAYSVPRDVEAIVSRLLQQMYNGQYNTSDNIGTQALVMSLESSSQAGNFGMGSRSAIPRSPIDNSIGNSVNAGNFRDFDHLTRNARSASNSIAAFHRFIDEGLTTGTAERDARALAFAWFTLGYAHGQTALLYDSASVIRPDPFEPIPALVDADEVAEWAIMALDSAIHYSNTAGSLAIPAGWLSDPSDTDVPQARFRQIARSLKARYRAGVARTPEERTAVDWNAVIADATAGVTEDFVVQVDVSAGWAGAGGSMLQQLAIDAGWSQMTPFILGMADTSGSYEQWLATPLMERQAFLMHTPDRRFPAGATREAQNAASGGTSRAGTAPGSILYFRALPSGEGKAAHPWGTWFYENHRFWGLRANGGNGPFVLLSEVENDMLAAEGYLRTNRIGEAAALIDKSRVRAGLPPVSGITSLGTPVPGGSGCVPRVPVAPNYTTTACGNIFEAMKWEKRLETSFTGYAQWFVDSRGWGDLVEGTPLEWPVPYQELFTRQRETYTNQARAARGTYGF